MPARLPGPSKAWWTILFAGRPWARRPNPGRWRNSRPASSSLATRLFTTRFVLRTDAGDANFGARAVERGHRSVGPDPISRADGPAGAGNGQVNRAFE